MMPSKPPFQFGLWIGLIAGALVATIGLKGALVAAPGIAGLWILASVLTDPRWRAKRPNKASNTTKRISELQSNR